VVGYSVTLVREATEARAEAERLAARLEERARLARAVHDGVLQVLALVQRRGRELGGEAAELGRMAGEQEVALRALVQGGATQARSAVVGAADGTADLGESLAELQSTAVTVAAPAQPVRLPADVAREVVLVVRACLDNVRRHVGEDAAAWVLLEDLGDRVVVSVRDEGPGVTEERLAQAEGEGRLGVSQSIRGRMVDLGGSAELVSRPGQGSEWELSVPTAR
jgi:signal transduction histidine kinase